MLHPHNFAIQIWAEFGLFGILIAMAMMNTLLSTIQNKFTVKQQKILLPTLIATMMPAAAAYGLWQGWWIAIMFHVAAMALIAAKFAGEDEATDKT